MTNIVLLAGNIGYDPETATTRGGTRITDFRLATSRPRRVDGKVVKGENGYAEQDTEWHRIKCFNGLAETVQKHCVKGMKVAV
ncbi:single-stranded DNA-binding protein, partial [Mesorhizobium sp. M5C.F.Cr.IN.023.01.1.1]|uniref:single-stranded DNA-binding protein n=1 Tax=Mesorhizobium sp. M5C.F.Cr.IN.023.01.1.1 TaxID=2496768 RepID=UPI000FD37520